MPISDRRLRELAESLLEIEACEADPDRVVDADQVQAGELCLEVTGSHLPGPWGACRGCASPFPCPAYEAATSYALECVIVASTALMRRWTDPTQIPAFPTAPVELRRERVAAEEWTSEAELMRLRYPPTGDPDLWVIYGPARPPEWDGPVEMLGCREVDAEAAARWTATGSGEL